MEFDDDTPAEKLEREQRAKDCAEVDRLIEMLDLYKSLNFKIVQIRDEHRAIVASASFLDHENPWAILIPQLKALVLAKRTNQC